MTRFPTLAAAAGLVLATGGSGLRPHHPVAAVMQVSSAATLHRFERLHPCPSTGLPYGGCPGWLRTHIVPLCAGGADAAANMQWLPLGDALDRLQGRECPS